MKIVASTTATAILVALMFMSIASVASAADTFTHNPPGQLTPKSGTGRKDTNVYAPEMRFPMEKGPAFANSQVWGNGGGSGPGGGQCDKVNFSYPWQDNYCESRSWDMPLCPSGQGHQGQDIRAATCEKAVHWVVAAVDGVITQVGSYSVYLTASDGTRYDYLHMSDVAVKEGDKVKREQHLGKVSNAFGGTPTTVHLHFNIKQNVAGVGDVYVPPYLSLVTSYEDLLGLHPKAPDAGPITTISHPTEPDEPKETTAAPLPPEPPPPEADTGCSTASAQSSAPSATFFALFGVAIVGAVRRRRQRDGRTERSREIS
jgi:MYXO-CTERM domain-containing protein